MMAELRIFLRRISHKLHFQGYIFLSRTSKSSAPLMIGATHLRISRYLTLIKLSIRYTTSALSLDRKFWHN